MHRRSYLPGSGSSNKLVKRRHLVRENEQLKTILIQTANAQNEARARARAAEEAKANSGIRGLFKKVKRALTRPINVGRNR